ncbi:MAG: hypothetical protein IPP15_16185 [Saprospiraceae bacterium]|uniref:Uncharacterized protein n=1 Tax=Candidatus Opimibacter skivensis TaxID=2982028 RepID=A0A9D7SVI2_9BACT|nr:hypothetical protein [Candidatus Opimibacter skivensis]
MSEIAGLSFRENYKRVLKDKSFSIRNQEDKEVYAGFLIEEGTHKRPVYGYQTLLDVFDALLENPLNETSRKVCLYKIDGEEEVDNLQINFEYTGNESYYMMFVAFQRLFDAIEQNADKPGKLDDIGFRLPGSLIKVADLVKEAIQTLHKESSPDNILYHYFITAELNRCIERFNVESETFIARLAS